MEVRKRKGEQTFMRRALQLAERGHGRTSPNPVVGAVVVRNGRVVGEGWHESLGRAHAERRALESAGRRARGATLYVTLEPCAHTGRTPPCTDAVIDAGIRRCVVALRDPHAIVDGRGLRALRRAGIEVSLGLCADQARRVLGGYWLAHTRHRPLVIWKVAATLDGRIADRSGGSRWITGVASRAAVHRMRARADAVLIGAGTARADDPRLTARTPRRVRDPLRVVCDTQLRLPLRLRLFGGRLAAGTVVACRRGASPTRRRALERRGVRVWELPVVRTGVSPRALARRLVRHGCHEVLLEGGAALGSAWLRAGLVDRIALFIAPRVLGAEGLAWCGPLGLDRLARARAGRVAELGRRGGDAYLAVDFGE
jgi:diaminohydroxyphosphoribosylaminopyrimidine deaminase/5-amino-6-(5-phosphoribosylamino)uracil reductase